MPPVREPSPQASFLASPHIALRPKGLSGVCPGARPEGIALAVLSKCAFFNKACLFCPFLLDAKAGFRILCPLLPILAGWAWGPSVLSLFPTACFPLTQGT